MDKACVEMAFLPPHETLSALVEEGSEDLWCNFNDSQQGFKSELESWAATLGVQLNGKWTCLSLWGDSAPSTKRDSLYLLCFTVLNGSFGNRLWICTFNKNKVCVVALVDALLMVYSKWWHGA